MSPILLALFFFVLCMLCLMVAVSVNYRRPGIALAFESAAVGCVLGLASCAATMHSVA